MPTPSSSRTLTAVVGLLFAAVALLTVGAAFLITAVAAPVAAATVDCARAATGDGRWRAPFAQSYVRTSGFGMRLHPIEHVWRLHSGVDLASLPGPGPVVAAHTGTVTVAESRPGIGLSVDLAHPDGVMSRYAHLASLAPGVHRGAAVAAGQQLGIEGSTGTSTGDHLHFEIQQQGVPVDPEPFMAARGAPLTGHAPTEPSQRAPRRGAATQSSLPPVTGPRLQSVTTPAAPIPARIRSLYVAAGESYGVPWTLLAGVGMEETRHGMVTGISSAGASGLMQFLPATWARYGVDGDGDGHARITDDADSIYAAAHYLAASGAREGPAGIGRALFAYNHADWYVADVLSYAHAYDTSSSVSTNPCPTAKPERGGSRR
ncbi:peptidoglycan DD-metalloendopeptidase family protein [Phycicoccus avicenniae]|uniref:peptidoglycan DD-metalloendopeptidase family protein n=1 Tax=Phycicoccus avicenniae TaxID=2828860 RepID=UPI003D28A1B9